MFYVSYYNSQVLFVYLKRSIWNSAASHNRADSAQPDGGRAKLAALL